MSKQIKNEMKGEQSRKRILGIRHGGSIAGFVTNLDSWSLQRAVAAEIAPLIEARQAADELAGLCGHYEPEAGVSEWLRSKEFGEASEGGEVQSKCGHGYYPAHAATGASDSDADLSFANAPLLAPCLAVADERGAVTAIHAETV